MKMIKTYESEDYNGKQNVAETKTMKALNLGNFHYHIGWDGGEGDRMARNIGGIEARIPMCRGNGNEMNARDDDVG